MPKVLPLLLIVLALITSACGSVRSVTVRGGTIEIGRDVPTASLLKGVLTIRRGSSASSVRSVFGTPWTKVSVVFRGDREICWAYHARQAKTSVDSLGFCLNEALRVARIMIGQHF